jgi:hypothetical protein
MLNDDQRKQLLERLAQAFDNAATSCTTADHAALQILNRLEGFGYIITKSTRAGRRRQKLDEAKRILGL